MSNLNLLPSGRFEVTMSDGSIVKGRYCSESFKMVSDINGGLTFRKTWEYLAVDPVMASVQLIMCAIKSEGKDVDEFFVLQVFQELGGMGSEDGQRLQAHFQDMFIPKKKMEQNGTLAGANS